MNKSDLVTFLSDDLEISKTEATRFLDSFTSAVFENARKEGVKISGFGSWTATKRKARIGRNPMTGEEVKIPSRWVPVFKAGSVLKESVSKSKRT